MTGFVDEGIDGVKSLSTTALFGFLRSYYDGDINLRLQAEESLFSLAELLPEMIDYSFANGIPGLGWMIEFLVQKNILSLNSDQVLAEVDDNCYKMVLNCALAKQTFEIGYVLGLATYHHIRAISRNEGQNFYRHFIHSQCLVLLSDILKKYLQHLVERLKKGEIDSSILKEAAICLLKIANLMTLLEKILETDFFNAVAAIFGHLREINSSKNIFSSEATNYMETCLLLMISMKQYANSVWENHFSELYEDFLDKATIEDRNNSLYGFSLIQCVLKNSVLKGFDLKNMKYEEVEQLLFLFSSINILKLEGFDT